MSQSEPRLLQTHRDRIESRRPRPGRAASARGLGIAGLLVLVTVLGGCTASTGKEWAQTAPVIKPEPRPVELGVWPEDSNAPDRDAYELADEPLDGGRGGSRTE